MGGERQGGRGRRQKAEGRRRAEGEADAAPSTQSRGFSGPWPLVPGFFFLPPSALPLPPFLVAALRNSVELAYYWQQFDAPNSEESCFGHQRPRFLKRILATPSPSGYESAVQQVVRDYVAAFADQVTDRPPRQRDRRPKPGPPLRVMLAGHCDQIGLIVQHIDDDGFLYVQPIGGWDPQVLIGQRMTVWTAGGPVLGVIARKPIHLLTEEERKQVPKMKDLWLDIGASDKEDARKAVRIGDAVTVELAFPRASQRQGRVARRWTTRPGCGWSSRPSAAPTRGKLRCGVYAVSTVQEEIGLRGARTSAFGIDPQVGVAVDVTHATDCPTIEKKEEGDVRAGQGAGDSPRPEHESQGGRAAVGRGRRKRDRLSTGRLRPRPPAPTPTPSRSIAPAWPPA